VRRANPFAWFQQRPRVVLLPRNWKSDAVPRLGSEGAQGVINKQLVDKADIVIALFDSRLGQATPRRRHTRAGLAAP
jgi:hypothetical protein